MLIAKDQSHHITVLKDFGTMVKFQNLSNDTVRSLVRSEFNALYAAGAGIPQTPVERSLKMPVISLTHEVQKPALPRSQPFTMTGKIIQEFNFDIVANAGTEVRLQLSTQPHTQSRHWFEQRPNLFIIFVGSSIATDKPVLIKTIVHELTHITNLLTETPDTGPSGVYHNEQFAFELAAHYYTAERKKGKGYAALTPDDQAVQLINSIDMCPDLMQQLAAFQDQIAKRTQDAKAKSEAAHPTIGTLMKEIAELKARVELLEQGLI